MPSRNTAAREAQFKEADQNSTYPIRSCLISDISTHLCAPAIPCFFLVPYSSDSLTFSSSLGSGNSILSPAYRPALAYF